VLRRVSVQSAQLAEALEHVAAHQAEREEAAVASERRRIAAELHDVISHSVSLMTIQTGAARLSLEADDRPVPPQLRAAEETGRAALVELRRALGLLRDEAGDAATLRPLPDLAAVPELVAQVREAGLDVELVQEVDREVPASLQLTAYRLLQEAFTNVLKHAGPVQVRAVLRTSSEGLVLSVVNRPGSADPLPTGGHGVDGMRQRVAVFGGTLSVGPRADRGYEVSAVLPIPATELEAAW
jgi:signal transduction histidine kinase